MLPEGFFFCFPKESRVRAFWNGGKWGGEGRVFYFFPKGFIRLGGGIFFLLGVEENEIRLLSSIDGFFSPAKLNRWILRFECTEPLTD
jgi:hypothetical protein